MFSSIRDIANKSESVDQQQRINKKFNRKKKWARKWAWQEKVNKRTIDWNFEKKRKITKSVLSREINIGQKETIYVRSKLMKLKELKYGKPSRNKTFTLHMGQTFKYRNRNRNLKLQDIQDKKGI